MLHLVGALARWPSMLMRREKSDMKEEQGEEEDILHYVPGRAGRFSTAYATLAPPIREEGENEMTAPLINYVRKLQ